MKKRFLPVLILALLGASIAHATDRPFPKIQKVMIISVDGLRPDLALRAETPMIHKMLEQGSFTFWARTTAESVTLPSHTSMLTGVTPVHHEIQWNKDLPLEHPVYPTFPTIFELAKNSGYTTAMVAGKSKFINLAKPETLDWQYIPDDPQTDDEQVTIKALEILRDHKPDVMFVHLPSVDGVGHASGWASPEQMAAIARADANIGKLMSAEDELKLRDSTMVIVTSDHGGAGLGHGPDDPRSRSIPWIVTGPQIRAGVDLTIYPNLTVDTEDTCCTACYALGLHPTRIPLDGKAVMEIFQQNDQRELIHKSQ